MKRVKNQPIYTRENINYLQGLTKYYESLTNIHTKKYLSLDLQDKPTLEIRAHPVLMTLGE